MTDYIEKLGFEPSHPGEHLREIIMPGLNMTVTRFAAHLGVTRQTLSRVVNGKSDISIEMAQRLGQALGNGPRFWLALQMQYDLWHALEDSEIDIAPIEYDNKAA